MMVSRLSGPRLFVALSLLALCCTAKTGQGTASTGDRDFPADVKASEWSGPEGQTYVMQLVVQSGGVGIGLGILFSLLMFFHLTCWGLCCDCCRCCCFRHEKIRRVSCFENHERYKYWLIAACSLFALSVVGVIIIFTNQSEMYEDIDLVFDHATTFLYDWEDFLCQGPIPAQLRGGMSVDEMIAYYGGTDLAAQQCHSGSLGGFLSASNTQVNTTFGSITTFIDGMTNILTALNSTIAHAENATAIADSINGTVFTMALQGQTINYTLGAVIATSSIFNQHLPSTLETPKADYQDLYLPGRSENELNSAVSELKTARSSLKKTIVQDLQQTTAPEIQKQWGTIHRALLDVEKQLFKNTKTTTSYESDVTDTQSSVGSTETIGELIMAVVYSLSPLFLLVMLVGYCRKKRWPMCCGAYSIFIFFVWLAFVLGVFLVLSMIVYDTCGCEGTYTADSCVTSITLLRTNIGNKTIKINDVTTDVVSSLEKILKCPVSEDANGHYIYTPDSNFIDILNLIPAFNFSDEVKEPLEMLSNATKKLLVTDEVKSAINFTSVARSLMARVAIGANYNFSHDAIKYRDTLAGLSNPTTAPTYYSTFNSAVNTANIARLNTLNQTNTEMWSERDRLNFLKVQYNASLLQTEQSSDGIDQAVNNSRDSIGTSIDNILNMVTFITTVNEYTPCGVIGKAYSNIWITDFCQNTYETIDGVVPGAILCLIAMLLGFFLLVMMRECIVIIHEEYDESSQEIKMGEVEPRVFTAETGIVAGTAPAPISPLPIGHSPGSPGISMQKSPAYSPNSRVV